MTVALEEGLTDFLFELADLLRQIALRNEQSATCCREVQRLCYHQKIFELSDFHNPILTLSVFRYFVIPYLSPCHTLPFTLS